MSQYDEFAYPALYDTADKLSGTSQRNFLNLIRTEYVLLLASSVFALDLSESKPFLIAYALVFLLSLGVSMGRSWQKPEQDWYKGRALAESIKTSCWRYCMGAEPFGSSDGAAKARSDFRDHLLAILRTNRYIGERIPADSAANDQITGSMEAVREYSLDQKKAYYEQFRIRQQRAWYAKKSGMNKRASRVWQVVSVMVYIIAILSVLLRIAYPEQKVWFTESLEAVMNL